MDGRAVVVVEVLDVVAGTPAVERRLEAAVAAVPARAVVPVDRMAEGVVPEIDVLEPKVELRLAAVGPVAVAGLRTVPAVAVVPAVRLSAVFTGLDVRALVRLAAVELNADFLSSSLALMLGRLR